MQISNKNVKKHGYGAKNTVPYIWICGIVHTPVQITKHICLLHKKYFFMINIGLFTEYTQHVLRWCWLNSLVGLWCMSKLCNFGTQECVFNRSQWAYMPSCFKILQNMKDTTKVCILYVWPFTSKCDFGKYVDARCFLPQTHNPIKVNFFTSSLHPPTNSGLDIPTVSVFVLLALDLILTLTMELLVWDMCLTHCLIMVHNSFKLKQKN